MLLADALSEETLIDYYTNLFCGSKDKIEHNRKGGKHVEHWQSATDVVQSWYDVLTNSNQLVP